MVTTVLRYAHRNKPKVPTDDIPISKISDDEMKDGWLRTDRYLPEDFELVALKVDFFAKWVPGWRRGECWEGLRVKKGSSYKYWKFLKGAE